MTGKVDPPAFDYDLAVIGGGPAGQAACLSLAGRVRIVVLDEQTRPGGQILRQPPRGFAVDGWMAGGAYRKLKARLAAFEALETVDFQGGKSVLGLREAAGGWMIVAAGEAGVEEISARRVLIAGGCYDMATPLTGWTLPGVMSAGGVQAFIKSQQLVPGRRLAFAGSHPLQLLVAEQAVKAGGAVAVVAFSQSLPRAALEVVRRPLVALAHAPKLMSALASGWRLRRAGVALRFGRRPLRVEGEAEAAALVLEGGERFESDTIALCFGFMPQSDLPRAAGMKVTAAKRGGWKVVHDDWMRTSRPGAYAAGETTGVKGAEAAAAEGELAGLAVALDAGLIGEGEAVRRARPVRRARRAALHFSSLLDAVANLAPLATAAMAGDTVICRCEDVCLDQVRDAAAACDQLNAIKLSTRCGMGACQGRNCEHVLRALVGASGELPGFTTRFPARPVRIGDMIVR